MGNPGRSWMVAAVAALALTWLPRLGHADEAGGAAVSYGKAGIKVGDQALFAGNVEGAAHDPAQELIWFTSKGTLSVIDLRDARRKPVAIAKKMPGGGFEVSGASTAGWNTDYAGIYPVIVVGAKPRVTERAGAYGDIWEDQDKVAKKAIKKIKIVGAKWLRAQAKRVPRSLPAEPSTDAVARATLPRGVTVCDDDESCGETRTFGATGYQLVVVSYGCGDACHMGCVLYDPKRKQVASPSAGGAWGTTAEESECFGYRFSPSGTSYVLGNARCDLGKQVSCRQLDDGAYIGWVAGASAATTTTTTAATTTGGFTEKDTAEGVAALVELGKLRDQACKCKGAACAASVEAGLETFMTRHSGTSGSARQADQATKLAEALMTCLSRAKGTP